MWKFLEGKKSYIVSGAIVVVSAAYGFGLLSKEQFETIIGVLIGLGAASVRSAIK